MLLFELVSQRQSTLAEQKRDYFFFSRRANWGYERSTQFNKKGNAFEPLYEGSWKTQISDEIYT